MHDLSCLTKELEKQGYQCQIETSGTQSIKCSLKTWVTVSPKKNQNTLHQAILRSNEIKYPVLNKEDLLYLEEILMTVKDKKKHLISLQPISQDEKSLKICIETCTIKNWRLSIQLHKYLSIK